jgi:alpha-L-fucosidase
MSIRTIAASLLLTTLAVQAAETPEQRDARMGWWREARFGMFVHWGLYSGLAGTWEGKKVGDSGGMEWIQQRTGVDTKPYAAAALPLFKPREGFAKEWARLAKTAGCKYIVFTTKHHEGFALHDSKLTDYDAFDATGRDLVKEIVEAARAEGLKVGFYHSVIDWHHDQYDFKRAKGLPYPKNGGGTGPRDHGKYIDFLHGQVDELVSNYGTVDVIWWDYSSTQFQGDDAWRAQELLAKVRAKQPGVIMNNRLYRIPEAGFSGMGTHNITDRMDPKYGDFVTPEQHIPATGMPNVDWETCMTLNTTWGYSEHDHKWKPARELIRNLVDIASKGGNYLLNIGPKGDGSLTPETVTAFEAMGRWMKVNGEAVYGTTASPFEKLSFDGRVTAKGKTLYAHVFKRPDAGVISLPGAFASARLLAGGATLEVRKAGAATEIVLPATLPDADVTVIEVR